MKTILKIIIFCFVVIFLLFGVVFHDGIYPETLLVFDIENEEVSYENINVEYYKRKIYKGIRGRGRYQLIKRLDNRYEITTDRMKGGETTFWGFTISKHDPTTYKIIKITWKEVGQTKLSINDIKSLPQETRPSDSIVYILDKQTFLKYLEE